jgi:hypothetical protein
MFGTVALLASGNVEAVNAADNQFFAVETGILVV